MVAPVRFSLVKDGLLAWTSPWLQASAPPGMPSTPTHSAAAAAAAQLDSCTNHPGSASMTTEQRSAYACEAIAGCSSLVLVVESEWSGGARCVWVDPHVLAAPLADVALAADLQALASSADVSVCWHV